MYIYIYCSKTFPTTPGHPMPCAAVLMAVMDSHTPSGVFEVMKMARLQKMIITISTNPDCQNVPVKSCFCSMKKMGNPWKIHGKNMDMSHFSGIVTRVSCSFPQGPIL